MRGIAMTTQRAIADKLNQFKERPEKSKNSTRVFLNQIIKGKRRLSPDWEPALLKATGCKDRDELKKCFPKILFSRGTEIFEFELVIRESKGVIQEDQLHKMLEFLRFLKGYGIEAEILMRNKT